MSHFPFYFGATSDSSDDSGDAFTPFDPTASVPATTPFSMVDSSGNGIDPNATPATNSITAANATTFDMASEASQFAQYVDNTIAALRAQANSQLASMQSKKTIVGAVIGSNADITASMDSIQQLVAMPGDAKYNANLKSNLYNLQLYGEQGAGDPVQEAAFTSTAQLVAQQINYGGTAIQFSTAGSILGSTVSTTLDQITSGLSIGIPIALAGAAVLAFLVLSGDKETAKSLSGYKKRRKRYGAHRRSFSSRRFGDDTTSSPSTATASAAPSASKVPTAKNQHTLGILEVAGAGILAWWLLIGSGTPAVQGQPLTAQGAADLAKITAAANDAENNANTPLALSLPSAQQAAANTLTEANQVAARTGGVQTNIVTDYDTANAEKANATLLQPLHSNGATTAEQEADIQDAINNPVLVHTSNFSDGGMGQVLSVGGTAVGLAGKAASQAGLSTAAGVVGVLGAYVAVGSILDSVGQLVGSNTVNLALLAAESSTEHGKEPASNIQVGQQQVQLGLDTGMGGND